MWLYKNEVEMKMRAKDRKTLTQVDIFWERNRQTGRENNIIPEEVE